MANLLHIEIAQKSTSKLKQSEILKLVKNAVEKVENPLNKFCLHDTSNLQLCENVESIKFCSGVTTLKMCQSDLDNVFWERKAHEFSSEFSSQLQTKKSEFYVFKLTSDFEMEKNLDKEISKAESNSLFRCFSLPCGKLHAEWETLVFDPALKTRLLDFIKTAIIYSQKCVSGALIDWSKVVLIHGPSGTGKTSLCRAFANKSVIRLGSRFKKGQLVEIDSQQLFAHRFSENVKLIERMFSKIRNFLQDSQTLVFLLIDQVENLANTNTKDPNVKRNETADSLRTVSSFLTKLDRIKTEFPNLVILTTSNVGGLIDVSFVDRADLKLFLGNPTAEFIYEIYASSINELIRVEIIGEDEDAFLPPRKQNFEVMVHQNYGLALKLWEISVLSVNFTGRILKRIPFLAHCNFVTSIDGSCSVDEYLEAMRSAVLAEKYTTENMDVKFRIPKDIHLLWNDSFVPQIISASGPQMHSKHLTLSSSFSVLNDRGQNCEEILFVPEEVPSTSAPQRQPSISAESTTTTATSVSISDSISTPSPNSTSGSSSSSSFNLKILNADVRVNITPLPSPTKKIKSTSQHSTNRHSSNSSELKREPQKKRKTMTKSTEKMRVSKSSQIKSRESRKSTAENSESSNSNQRQSQILSPNFRNNKTRENIEKKKKIPKETESDTNDEETDDSDLSERRRSSRISRQTSKTKQVPKVEMTTEFFITKHLNPDVEVKLSEILCAGQGLFAKKSFQPGEFLTEYGGELLSRKEGIGKEKEYQTADKSLFLFFFTHEEKHYCIDAMESRSYGRFINHSKARANAIVKRVTVEGLPKLYFVASKPIRKGGEILYDYGETRLQVLKQLPWLKF